MCQAMLSPRGQAISKDTDKPFTEYSSPQRFTSSIRQIISMLLMKKRGTNSQQQNKEINLLASGKKKVYLGKNIGPMLHSSKKPPKQGPLIFPANEKFVFTPSLANFAYVHPMTNQCSIR